MYSHIYEKMSEYPVAVLVRTINPPTITREYLHPIELNPAGVVVLSLHYTDKKIPPKQQEQVEYLTSEIIPTLQTLQTKYILCGDSHYFKALTGVRNAEKCLGYVLPCKFADMLVVYVPSCATVLFNPVGIRPKILRGLTALRDHLRGTYTPPGTSIVHFAEYPKTDAEISAWLERLLEMGVPLSVDIETFGLQHVSAGIGTITFCWNKHEGIAFPVDCEELPQATEAPFHRQVRNDNRRALLRNFFTRCNQPLYFHRAAFDVTVLTQQIWMKTPLDQEGLLEGLGILSRNWEDTLLISYLATNSCAGNTLSLKAQSAEFCGDYALDDIKDITRIPLPSLLNYNLVDGLATHFVFSKRMPQVIQYGQEELYNTLFKPALVDIIQMQLTGLPVDMPAVAAARVALEADSNNARTTIANSVSVLECVDVLLKPAKAEAMNKKWKVKRITAAEVPFEFNPRSAPQIQQLLFKFYALPVLEKTDAGHPSTEGDVLKALMAHTNDPEILSVLQALVDFKAVDIILGTFIPALEGAVLGPDGWHYLYGNFNLGGTVSGRLSSSDPNLQNLPSTGSKYAKIIKTCIKAPPGWLFAGADFLSLEDRISALTTKDPNKQKVYLEGYDGHSLRAYSYYPEAFVGVPETVTAINAIAKTHPELRQSSKKPTFTLTYQGTYATLMRNCGFTEEKAREIEANYHKLYAHSDAWLQCKLDQAAVDGYVTLAFGLRLCTPLLHQVIRGTRKVPSEAAAEGRTAGNALGQSWGLLNTRAGLAFMRIVRQSKHRYDVRPCAHIHDAQYYLVRDCEETVLFTNTHLCGEMAWQDHPEIAHPDIPLGGELDIFYPNWASKITIPNGADAATLHKTISSTLAEWADTTKKAAR